MPALLLALLRPWWWCGGGGGGGVVVVVAAAVVVVVAAAVVVVLRRGAYRWKYCTVGVDFHDTVNAFRNGPSERPAYPPTHPRTHPPPVRMDNINGNNTHTQQPRVLGKRRPRILRGARRLERRVAWRRRRRERMPMPLPMLMLIEGGWAGRRGRRQGGTSPPATHSRVCPLFMIFFFFFFFFFFFVFFVSLPPFLHTGGERFLLLLFLFALFSCSCSFVGELLLLLLLFFSVFSRSGEDDEALLADVEVNVLALLVRDEAGEVVADERVPRVPERLLELPLEV